MAATCRSEVRSMALDNITPGIAIKGAVKRKRDHYLKTVERMVRSYRFLLSTALAAQQAQRAQT